MDELEGNIFPTTGAALKHIIQLDQGQILVRTGHFISRTDEGAKDHLNDLFFESETEGTIYDYTIEEFKNHAKLTIRKTYKHPMITAAKNGDLGMLIQSFVNTDKMIGFSLSEAIRNENINIVEHLIQNHGVKSKASYFGIRFDKPEVIKLAFRLGAPICQEWLAQCAYNNSIMVTKEFLLNQCYHKTIPKEQYMTKWLKKELEKDNEAVKIIKEAIDQQ